MAVRAVQGRAVHGEHRVEEAERGGEGSRNHQAGVPPPVATLVRHASDEQGTDLKIVKELLGHNQLKTTEMYVHIADTFKSSIRTPLDDILEGDNEIVK